MATGYDTRQGGRQTFAFQPKPTGRQGGTTLQPVSTRVGIQGGQSRGEVVNANNPTGVSDATAARADVMIPGFLNDLAKPFVERKKMQRMFEGFNLAASGISAEEIERDQPAWAKLFGDTDVAAAAQVYGAQEKLSGLDQRVIDEKDTLKLMSPEDFSQWMTYRAEELMTDSPGMNAMLQEGFMKKSFMWSSLITKERIAHQQVEGIKARTTSTMAAAKAVNSGFSAYASLASPTDGDIAGMQSQRQEFLSQFGPHDDESNESYEAFILGSARLMLQEGNLYAFRIMQEGKIFDALPIEKRDDVETWRKQFQKDAVNRVIQEDPELRTEMQNIRVLSAGGLVSGPEAMSRADAFNSSIMRKTGSTEGFFTNEEVAAFGSSAMLQRLNEARRMDDRAYTEGKEAAKKATEQAETESLTRQVLAGKAPEVVASAGAAGREVVDRVMVDRYRSDPEDFVSLAVASRGEVGTSVPKLVQQDLIAARTTGYDDKFKSLYGMWSEVYKAPGGAAATVGLFGNIGNTQMLAMDRMVKSGYDPAVAYQMSFADSFAFDVARMTSTQIKEGRAAAVSAIQSFEGWRGIPGGLRKLNKSSRAVAENALVAGYSLSLKNNPGADPTKVSESNIAHAEATGLELHGAFAYQRPPTASPLAQVTNIPRDILPEVLDEVIGSRMVKAGYGKGSRGDNYMIVQTPDTTTATGNGKATSLIVTAFDGAENYTVHITSEELRTHYRTEADRLEASDRARNEAMHAVTTVPKVGDGSGRAAMAESLENSMARRTPPKPVTVGEIMDGLGGLAKSLAGTPMRDPLDRGVTTILDPTTGRLQH